MGTHYRLNSPITSEEIRELKEQISAGDLAEEYIRVEDAARQQVKKKVRYRITGKYRHLVELEPIAERKLKRESATYVELLMRKRNYRGGSVRDIRLL